jgi:hypothetical protein
VAEDLSLPLCLLSLCSFWVWGRNRHQLPTISNLSTSRRTMSSLIRA